MVILIQIDSPMTISEFQSHALPVSGALHAFHSKLSSLKMEHLLHQLQSDWPVWTHQSI